jgi:glycosyltransferase involved in cell wall biosynthesis
MICRYSVAVIIPCFESSKFIRKTIESALNQDYDDLEIIAIDDGSTDETRKILESYLPKIRILSHPNNANLGAATSLNLGINETKSYLIAFLDSDDIWHPNKLKEQVKIFQKYWDVGLVYTNGCVIEDSDDILYKLFPDDFQEENIYEKICHRDHRESQLYWVLCVCNRLPDKDGRDEREQAGFFGTDYVFRM